MWTAKTIHVHISFLCFYNFDIIETCAEGLLLCPKKMNN